MPNLVELTASEEAFAADVGKARQKAFERMRWRDIRPGIKGEAAHVMGAKCELAFAKFLGTKWDAKVFNPNDFNEVTRIFDVAGCEVRGTEYRNAHLPIKSKDKDDAPFVLVIRSGSLYEMAGWIYGRDGKQDRWVKDYGYSLPWVTYMVPRMELIPMSKLAVMEEQARLF